MSLSTIPEQLLHQIIRSCDADAAIALRAVSRRLHDLVDVNVRRIKPKKLEKIVVFLSGGRVYLGARDEYEKNPRLIETFIEKDEDQIRRAFALVQADNLFVYGIAEEIDQFTAAVPPKFWLINGDQSLPSVKFLNFLIFKDYRLEEDEEKVLVRNIVRNARYRSCYVRPGSPQIFPVVCSDCLEHIQHQEERTRGGIRFFYSRNTICTDDAIAGTPYSEHADSFIYDRSTTRNYYAEDMEMESDDESFITEDFKHTDDEDDMEDGQFEDISENEEEKDRELEEDQGGVIHAN